MSLSQGRPEASSDLRGNREDHSWGRGLSVRTSRVVACGISARLPPAIRVGDPEAGRSTVLCDTVDWFLPAESRDHQAEPARESDDSVARPLSWCKWWGGCVLYRVGCKQRPGAHRCRGDSSQGMMLDIACWGLSLLVVYHDYEASSHGTGDEIDGAIARDHPDPREAVSDPDGGKTSPTLLDRVRDWGDHPAWSAFLSSMTRCCADGVADSGSMTTPRMSCASASGSSLMAHMRTFRYDPSRASASGSGGCSAPGAST